LVKLPWIQRANRVRLFPQTGTARKSRRSSPVRAATGLFLASLTFLTSACGSSPRDIARKDTVLYAAFGASDAFGIGAEPITNGYVYRIRDVLDRQIDRVSLVNLGIPGAEIDRIAETLRVFLRTRAQPDIVTMWTGANDIIAGRLVADFEPELDRMLTQLRAETKAFVAIANIPDLTKLPRFAARPEPTVTTERVRQFNAAIARQAQRHEIPLVNLFIQPIESELVSGADGFHPSNAGHARIAQHFLDIILPAIGLRREVVAARGG
jgi:lysophospholipase L1-like esterase